MVNFVRDVRKDLGVRELPIVIGELGMDGVEVNPRYAHKHYAVREAQAAPYVASANEGARPMSAPGCRQYSRRIPRCSGNQPPDRR